MRCLASRSARVYWQQRIKDTQEVFTLVRRRIFAGVKDLCMHLFSQGQPLLPLFLDYFLLQAYLFALWPYSWCQATFPLALLQSLCPWSVSNFRVLSTYSFSPVPIKYRYFLTSFPAIAWLVAIPCPPLYSQVLVCISPNPCCPVQAFKTVSVYIHLFGALHGLVLNSFPRFMCCFLCYSSGRESSESSQMHLPPLQCWAPGVAQPGADVAKHSTQFLSLVPQQARCCWAFQRCKAAV